MHCFGAKIYIEINQFGGLFDSFWFVMVRSGSFLDVLGRSVFHSYSRISEHETNPKIVLIFLIAENNLEVIKSNAEDADPSHWICSGNFRGKCDTS